MKTARAGYLVTVGILVGGYYALPGLRPAVVAAIGALSVAAVGVGLVRLRPQRLGAWLLVAAAALLLAVGDVAFTVMVGRSSGPVGYPASPDVFYLAACLPLTAGLLWLGRPRLPSRDWPMILDTVSLSLAGSLLVWITLVRPAVTSMQLTGAGKVTAIASWVGVVAVLAASARVVLAWRTNLALALLACGVVAFLVSGFFYSQQLITGTWTGGPIDLGFVAFGVLSGAAALSPSMRRVASATFARHQLGPLRLAMVAVALLVAPTALLVEATSGPVTTGVAIAVVSAVVSGLMLMRLSLAAQAYRRRAGREHAMREASRSSVLATTEEEVVDGARTALAGMLPAGTRAEVRVVDRRQGDLSGRSLVPVADGTDVLDGVVGELTVPIGTGAATTAGLTGRPPEADRTSTGAVVFVAPMAQLLELSPILDALADQAASALQRIELVSRLRVKEREQYFRTLVLTSDDVTLISRDGRVAYATPSARSLFGGDVVGERFDNLVRRRQPDDDGEGLQPEPAWPNSVDGVEGYIDRGGSALTVTVRRRDLTTDPTVSGVVTTVRDVTAERNLQRDLAYRASHDPLTGLANAQLFSDILHTDVVTTADRDIGTAALFIDLDDFKTVNDTFGHEVGNKLLSEVAQRIRHRLRPDDLAARLGGDEFAVLLRNLADADAARDVAQHLADALTRPAILDSVTVDCQASIGLAYAEGAGHLDSLVKQADTALYAAKATGKGRWRQYREGMPTPTRQQIDNRRRLEDALRSGALTLQYQPIVELASGTAVGFEALIRLPGADPPISPVEIIQTAEHTGLITAIGDWVLRRALADLVRLNPPQSPRRRYVSVNVSPRQLRQPDFVDNVRAHLAAAGTDPRLLVLEITEQHLVDDDDRTWAFLADLRHDGIRIAIDDYGTGYASLSYLRQPGIDIVKIDQSFLADLTHPRSQILLETITALCNRLGLDQIAEGVQSTATRDALLAVGCRHGQGSHYSPAIPVAQAIKWRHVVNGA